MIPVICFVGSSGAGKTTVIENIVPDIKARGYRVAVVKHAPHGFDSDIRGKDSWRFSQTGADIVAEFSEDKLCLMGQLAQVVSLEQIISMLDGHIDMVLVEGLKWSQWPKIEVARSSVSRGLLHTSQELVAIISDQRFPLDLPQFSFHDTRAIASFVIEQLAVASLDD